MASEDQGVCVRRFSNSEVLRNRVVSHCDLEDTISTIKKTLNEAQMKKFQENIFGRFLELNVLKFSGHVVNHMLFRGCLCEDVDVLVFNFGGAGARFTQMEFGLITGLVCGPQPTVRVAHSTRICDKYFGGAKTIKNSMLRRVFKTAKCKDNDPTDDDRLKLALLFFLETILLKKNNDSAVPKEHIEMVDDLEYFQAYPWGTASYRATIESLRCASDKLLNPAHMYTLYGFPLAFMIWGYETIPSLGATYGNKSEEIKTPRILNWTVTQTPEHDSLKEFFSRLEYEVVGVLEHTESELAFVQSNFLGARDQLYETAPIVGDKPPQDDGVEEDGAAALPLEINAREKKRKHNEVSGNAGTRARQTKVPSLAPHQLSSPAAPHVVLNEGSSVVEDRLSRLEGEIRSQMTSLETKLCSQLTSLEAKVSSQLTSLEAKLDSLFSLFIGRTRPGVQSKEEDDDSRRQEDGLGSFDDGIVKVGVGVGTFSEGDEDDTINADLGCDAIPTEDVRVDAIPTDGGVSQCSVKQRVLLWPRDENLTLEWITNLKESLDWSTRNLIPSKFPSVFPVRVFYKLVLCASRILKQEANFVRIDPYKLDASAVVVVGDLHGQLHDLLFLLNDAGFPSQNRIFIFNGDFVDKGAWGLETLLILLACKVFMPQKVYLHRGNHETKDCTSRYGFKNEVLAKYGDAGRGVGQHAYDLCMDCFNALPLASVVFERVYIAHGGLFRSLKSESEHPLSVGSLDDLLQISRRKVSNPQHENLIDDILWSDPAMTLGFSLNIDRNVGLLWGPDCTEIFLKQNNLKLIIRSHEGPEARVGRPGFAGMDNGFTIDHEVESGRLITVFSAPDYPQFQATEDRFKNKGAYLVLKSPNFDDPEFHSFEAVSRPLAYPFYEIDSDELVDLDAMATDARRI